MSFIIKTQCFEAVSEYSKVVVTEEGEWVWVIEEPEGWVEATSRKACSLPPDDVLVFQTKEKALNFISNWKGHPWYNVPNGVYEIIEVVPRMKTIQDGWDIK